MASFNYDVMPNLPKIKKGRSKFNLSHTSHLDFNAGLLVPLDRPIPVLPGDSFDVGQRIIIRMSNPPKVPVMDTLCMTVAWYYVPYRILWSNWDKFITGDNGTQWDQDLALTIPTITLTAPVHGTNNYYDFNASQGKLLDFLGVTPNFPSQTLDSSDGVSLTTSISAFESLGYYRIWNDFYRYTPLMDEIVLSKTTTTYTLNESLTYTNGVVSNALCPVVRFADYFSRCLPQPQRGSDVLMDLSIPYTYDASILPAVNGLFAASQASSGEALSTYPGSTASLGSYANINAYALRSDSNHYLLGFANLSGGTINQLREAFAIQALKDIDAKYGTRITDWSYGHFGVTVPNSLVQMPEELSYQTFDINVNQVVQTSSTTADSPQGTVGAYSATSWDKHSFFKSFTEYGLIYNLGCIRVKHHSYSQGLDAQYMRKTRFDYYIPELANIADQPVYKRELSFGVVLDDSGDPVMDESVFGYQEAWAAYKFLPSRLSNHMRPNATDTLAIWNYADYYDSTPTLSSDWVTEPTANIDRTMFLASDNDVTQFICDIFYKISAFRTMPYHSIPGGLTHEF